VFRRHLAGEWLDLADRIQLILSHCRDRGEKRQCEDQGPRPYETAWLAMSRCC
jgi:hypothetical protein